MCEVTNLEPRHERSALTSYPLYGPLLFYTPYPISVRQSAYETYKFLLLILCMSRRPSTLAKPLHRRAVNNRCLLPLDVMPHLGQLLTTTCHIETLPDRCRKQPRPLRIALIVVCVLYQLQRGL